MKDFINWCVQHWQFLLSIFGILASILILIFKPRTKANTWDSIIEDILSLVPGFIYEAEMLLINGQSKKRLVIDTALKYAKNRLGRSLSDYEVNDITNRISTQIEAILFCPTKKGGIGRGS